MLAYAKKGQRYHVYEAGNPKPISTHSTRASAVRQVETRNRLERILELSRKGQEMAIAETEILTEDASVELAITSDEAEEEETDRKPWEGVLALVGHPTGDKRLLIPGEIGYRDLPVPFLVQTETNEGHMGSEVAGRIEKVELVPLADFERAEEFHLDGDITKGAVVVWAEGTLDGSPAADEAERHLLNGAGVSIDLPPDRIAPFDPDTLEEVDPEDLSFEELIFGNFLTGIAGKIAAATIVSVAAFEETSVQLVNEHALVASAYGVKVVPGKVLTAAAAGLAPLKPPARFFERKEADHATPLTVTGAGEVYGHLALWDSCHTNFPGCEGPPRSATGYSFFHLGQVETKEGEMVNVGRITVGSPGAARGGHASIVRGRSGAMEHYDNSGCVAAFVRATDGEHGIWLSGVVSSDVPAERIRDLRANPPSGDWRDDELVAVLAVPVPGFPIPRAEMRLVASGATERVEALVASGYAPHLHEEGERVDVITYRRRMEELAERRQSALAEEASEEEFYWEAWRTYTADERKRMAKSGQALPDGSFPIRDCADAENAIRAQGRASSGKRPRVRAHIRKRVAALGCSGDIFDDYK